jgi:hypothetical protein
MKRENWQELLLFVANYESTLEISVDFHCPDYHGQINQFFIDLDA